MAPEIIIDKLFEEVEEKLVFHVNEEFKSNKFFGGAADINTLVQGGIPAIKDMAITLISESRHRPLTADEREAIARLAELIEQRFGEDE